MKERMRSENAIYGGEMSAHHYFKDFAYCDSGMIPWLLVTMLMSKRHQTLSKLVQERSAAFPCSGEINRQVDDPHAVLNTIQQHYKSLAQEIDFTDGVSMSFPNWRFNLRLSNTEPIIRLNVESRADKALMTAKTEELLALIST